MTSIKDIKSQVENEAKKILNVLGVCGNIGDDILTLYRYVVSTVRYDTIISNEKQKYTTENFIYYDLYNGFIRKKGVCTTMSYMFSYLLEKIGVSSLVVGMESKIDDTEHCVVLILIDGKFYYFDPATESMIYEECDKKPQYFLMAGLGSKFYHQYYIPNVVMPSLNSSEKQKEIPLNISEESLNEYVLRQFLTNSFAQSHKEKSKTKKLVI